MSSSVSKRTVQRVDRLLRSLVGVADLRLAWDARGTLRSVHILSDAAVQPHQIVRNVVSGLSAGFAIDLDASAVRICEDRDQLPQADEAADPAASGSADTDAGESVPDSVAVTASLPSADPAQDPTPASGQPAPSNGNGSHGGNGKRIEGADGNASGTAKGTGTHTGGGVQRPAARNGMAAVPRPVPSGADVLASVRGVRGRADAGEETGVPGVHGLRLERMDVERHGAMLRCRIVLMLGEQSYSAIAEAPDGPSAEADLAARVALDALRAGDLTAASLDGIGFITIGESNYVVAAVRGGGTAAPRAGAAPLVDSMAWSAALAVLSAAGRPAFTPTHATGQ